MRRGWTRVRSVVINSCVLNLECNKVPSWNRTYENVTIVYTPAMKLGKMRWAWHETPTWEMSNAYTFLSENVKWRDRLDDQGVDLGVILKFDLLEMGSDNGDFTVWNWLRDEKAGNSLTKWSTISFSRRTLPCGLYAVDKLVLALDTVQSQQLISCHKFNLGLITVVLNSLD
jgi:hypothetical protein